MPQARAGATRETCKLTRTTSPPFSLSPLPDAADTEHKQKHASPIGTLTRSGSLERVRELQAVRKKSKGITPVDAALGKEFRKAGADAAEQREAAAAVEEESKYGLQVFAAGDASAKKETTEEDRMRKYVEERLSGQPKAREGEGEGEEDDGFLAKAFNRPKVSEKARRPRGRDDLVRQRLG